MIKFYLTMFLLIVGFSAQAAEPVIHKQLNFSGKNFALYQTLNPAALLIADEGGQLLYSDNIEQAMVPASTTKLITALLALQHWGAEHRFYTDFTFYPCQTNAKDCARLEIKAYGDPFLVSEELAQIAATLAEKLQVHGISHIEQMALVNHWYQQPLVMPGAGKSLNPYDAINGALVANFNSLNARKNQLGWQSAEEQTPWVSVADDIVQHSGLTLKQGKSERINTGADTQLNQQYAVELLQAFLKKHAITTANSTLQIAQASQEEPRFTYRHQNSRTLAEVVQPMMKYSTNFIANQIALNLAAEVYGAPASGEKVQRLFHDKLSQQFGWSQGDVHFLDGAGLSRENRINAYQLYQVLEAFKPWKGLLPEIEQGVYAKSGSLIGVSTLAGYFHHRQQWMPFVFLSNQRVPYRFRNRLAKSLSEQLP
ncbi:D-alanyl-D-alanine carboxypeptidase [Thiomicrorhabdus sp. 6S2-11]|uniref:D-alanyl-D-alanine carboxypeptidase n=1 Tax=Thiomicrorhabdus marina TaxID=2818442 RepID=A0ABS3Q4F2_9GAMM|nr:D-alanyl-D-alanine carboxypeptidase [Thiomicrorhabdus marina]